MQNAKEKNNLPGILSLVLGLAGVCLFACCVNYPLGIAAIVLGIIQLVRKGDRAPAIAGIISGVAAILLGIALAVGVASLVSRISTDPAAEEYEDFIEDYLEDYLENFNIYLE